MAAQRDEFEGDAGRYRWLREHSGEFQGPEIFVNGKYELCSDLDAAIDAHRRLPDVRALRSHE